MPGKNTLKVFVPNSYYHLYNRGWNRSDIFLEAEDYEYFEAILARHLSANPVSDSRGRTFPHYANDIQLLAYCLMPNHFHLVVYQHENERSISRLMSSVLTAYTMYFNRKYKRRGSLFENTYRAVPITNDGQLMHITRYVHLNHPDFRTWDWSSYQDYLWESSKRTWIQTRPILELFPSVKHYEQFVEDYEAMQRERDMLKHDLANG